MVQSKYLGGREEGSAGERVRGERNEWQARRKEKEVREKEGGGI